MKTEITVDQYRQIKEFYGDDLEVYASYSAPEGDQFGDPSTGIMKTIWAISDTDKPLIESICTWPIEDTRGWAIPVGKSQYKYYVYKETL